MRVFVASRDLWKKYLCSGTVNTMFALELNAYIEKAFSPASPGQTFYRVLSGPYPNKSSVNNAREKLIKNGSRPLILTRCKTK